MGRETRCPYIFMSMGHVQSPTGETKKDKTQSVPYKRPRWCSLQASIETRDQDKPFLLQVSPSPFLLIIEAHVLALSLEDKLLEGKTHHHFNLDGRDQEEMDSQWHGEQLEELPVRSLEKKFSSKIVISFLQRSFTYRLSDTCLRRVDRFSPEVTGEDIRLYPVAKFLFLSSSLLPFSVSVSTRNEDSSFCTRILSLRLCS